MRTAPLCGLTVVTIEQAVAAPFCTARLADSGARVIKVERPEGDFARGYDESAPGSSSYFVWLNRGKESVALNLSSREGKQTLAALIDRADILVQNLRPGAMSRMGFDIDRLLASRPELISCSISGYGEQGPFAHRKAYDLLVQAESGLCSITGGPTEPSRVGISVVDISTGATAYAAILEALISRGLDGVGADIRISMFDVIAEWLTVPLLNETAGRSPRRIGLGHPSIAPYGVFVSADGRHLLISIQNDREWRVFCRDVLQRHDLLEDARFASNVLRVRHRIDTDAAVSNAFKALSSAKVMERLATADIAFAELNDMAALSRHPHLTRITVGTEAGSVSFPAPAPIFAGIQRQYGPVPALGEHNVAIEQELRSTGLRPTGSER